MPAKSLLDNLRERILTIIRAFNQAIVSATQDLVCAYKPNMAFYEAHGPEGISALKATIEYIRLVVPSAPVILDGKRAA